MRQPDFVPVVTALFGLAALTGCGGNTHSSTHQADPLPNTEAALELSPDLLWRALLVDGPAVPDTTDPTGTPDLVVLDFTERVSYEMDEHEPNDRKSDATFIDFAPALETLSGYLHERRIEFTVTLGNEGVGTAYDIDVDVFPNANEPDPGDQGDLRAVVDKVLPGDAVEVTLTLADAESGDYDAWTQLDTLDQIAESDETNNISVEIDPDVDEDEDWFEFYQDDGYFIDLELDQLPADYDIELYSYGYYVDGSHRSGTDDERVRLYAPWSGYYQIVIFGHNDAASDATPYRLTVDLD